MDRFDDRVRCRRQESVDEVRAGDRLGLRAAVALELRPDAGEREQGAFILWAIRYSAASACRSPDRTTALHCLGAAQMLLQRGKRMLRPPVEAVRVLLDKRYVEHRFAFCQART